MNKSHVCDVSVSVSFSLCLQKGRGEASIKAAKSQTDHPSSYTLNPGFQFPVLLYCNLILQVHTYWSLFCLAALIMKVAEEKCLQIEKISEL